MRILSLLVVFSAASAYAAPPAPCDLITPAQAQTLMGGKAGAGQSLDGPIKKCAFTDPNSSNSVEANYIAVASLNLPNPSMAVEIMKQTPGVQQVAGLGDFATYTAGQGVFDIVVLYHGYMIGLEVHGPEKANPKDAMIALTRGMMGKF